MATLNEFHDELCDIVKENRRILRKLEISEISCVDKPANEARAFLKRDSSGDNPVETFAKDYRDGRYDHCTSAEFGAILQGEAQKRFDILHEQEIAQGVGPYHPTQKRYTSLEKVYSKLIEEPAGRAILKALKTAAYGASLEPAPVEKAAPVSPFADERPATLEAARHMGKNATRYSSEFEKVAAARGRAAIAPPEDDPRDPSPVLPESADEKFRRIYGHTLSIEEARALGPNAGRRVAMPLSTPAVARSPGQRAAPGIEGRGGLSGEAMNSGLGKGHGYRKVIGPVSPTVAQLRAGGF